MTSCMLSYACTLLLYIVTDVLSKYDKGPQFSCNLYIDCTNTLHLNTSIVLALTLKHNFIPQLGRNNPTIRNQAEGQFPVFY